MIAVPGLEALALPDLSEPAVLLARLGRASLTGGAFVAAVWAVLRAMPRLPAGLRCALWWTAGLKLLVALLWTAPLELPVLPAAEPVAAASLAAAPVTGPTPATGLELPTAPAPAPAATGLRDQAATPFPWQALLAALWLAGVAVGAVRLGRELAAARRLRRETAPADPALTALFDDLRRRLGVRQAVDLRLSGAAPGPLTLGLLKPAVVLPARDLERLSRPELEMALAHELLHVRRRDLWTGWVPLLARRLFFFHPFAALAAREYLLAREAACDAGVLRELGAQPRSYGRLLLLWSRRQGAGAPPAGLATAGASSTFLDLKRRLLMLQSSSPPSWRLKLAAAVVAAAAVAALLPLRIVAQPADPAPSSGSTWTYTDDGAAWAFLEPGGSAWMHGNSRDVPRIKALQADADSALLWFRRDGREYVIRDPATLDQARTILEPQRELGRRQGELGGRQGELGGKQGELGARQGELGRQQGELGARQAELAARMATLAAERARLHARRMNAGDGEESAIEDEEAALETRTESLEDEMEELGSRQAALGERQAALGREQAALGERQAALGEQQAELGRRQEEAARRADRELRQLFDRAVAQGLAEPIE